jgi:prepilin peptidase CpaA
MALAEPSHLAVLAVVTVAATFDLIRHRIPNALTYSSWAVGFALGMLLGGVAGLIDSLLGFAAGFLPLLVLYVGGSLGGGDVKLMGGVGALLGFSAGLNALISAILVGGFLAAFILLWQGRLLAVLKYALSRLWGLIMPAYVPLPEPPERKDAFPFGVAIALGTYLTVASIWLGAATPAALFR